MNKEIDRIMEILQKAGDSNAVSRKAVLDFHGNADNMQAAAKLWATHHYVIGSDDELFIAYATAVDLGYRIAGLRE